MRVAWRWAISQKETAQPEADDPVLIRGVSFTGGKAVIDILRYTEREAAVLRERTRRWGWLQDRFSTSPCYRNGRCTMDAACPFIKECLAEEQKA